jgi:hypothetical protein
MPVIYAKSNINKVNVNVVNRIETEIETDPVFTSAKDTDVNLTANSDAKVATQKATKAYVDSKIKSYIVSIGKNDPTADFNTADYASDSACIQSVIENLHLKGGGNILIKKGTYIISSILIPRSNVNIEGEGVNITILEPSATATPSFIFLNNGTTVGNQYVDNATLSNFTINANNLQCGAIAIFSFNNLCLRNLEMKNILAVTTSKWTTRLGALLNNNETASKSTNLTVDNCQYINNQGRTYEQLLVTNTTGINIIDNYFTDNKSLSPLYDEISIFIYNDNVTVQNNKLINSSYHGIGCKESNNILLSNNLVTRTGNSYTGLRSYNTQDSTYINNKLIFPEFTEIIGDITAGNTFTITSANTTANLFVGQKILGLGFPANTKIASIVNTTSFTVSTTLVNSTNVTIKLTTVSNGIEVADRNIGADLQPQRYPYTTNLIIRNNYIKNAFVGISATERSIGTNTTANCDLSGTTITLLTGTTANLYTGQKMYNANISENTYITAIVNTTQVTVSTVMTTATNTSVFFDSNTITYRARDIEISDNRFINISQNAIKWGINSLDVDTRNLYIKDNYIGDYYSANESAIVLTGNSNDITKFTNVNINGNTFGKNLETTNSGAISCSAITVHNISNNIVSEIGSRGVINLSNNSIVLNNRQKNPIIYTANKTLSFEEIIYVDASAGAILIAPPNPAVWVGKQYKIIKIDSSANIVNIDPSSSALINGISSFVLTNQYDSIEIISDGTQYHILSIAKISSLQESLLATPTISALTFNNVPIYTVPAGRTLIITKAFIRPTTVTGTVTTAPAISIGGNSTTFDNFLATTTLTNTTTTGRIFTYQPNLSSVATYSAGQVITAQIDTAQIGATALTYTIDLFGYLL